MAAFSVLSSWPVHPPRMKQMTRSGVFGAMVALSVLAVGLAPDSARGDNDHDEAWKARRGGEVLPLPDVRRRISPHIDGEIIETEFEYEHGRPVYEFKYVDKNGRVREVYVDARTGTILEDKPD